MISVGTHGNLRRRPRLVAHRGRGSEQEPENSLEALHALPEWTDGVEFDVQVTADGVPVLMHDPSLERTTNGRGSVSEATFDQVREASLVGGEQIPTLAAALDVCAQRVLSPIVVDMTKPQAPWATEAVITVLKESSVFERCHVLVARDDEVRAVRGRDPDVALVRGGIGGTRDARTVVGSLLAGRVEIAMLRGGRFLEDRWLIAPLEAAGLRVAAGTTKSRLELAEIRRSTCVFVLAGRVADLPDWRR